MESRREKKFYTETSLFILFKNNVNFLSCYQIGSEFPRAMWDTEWVMDKLYTPLSKVSHNPKEGLGEQKVHYV